MEKDLNNSDDSELEAELEDMRNNTIMCDCCGKKFPLTSLHPVEVDGRTLLYCIECD